MESDAGSTATAGAAASLGDSGNGGGAEPMDQPPPPAITNAILSQAVTSAISQFDTKRAFDMMLLNEQMGALESDATCAKEEARFLRAALAKQTQETSEMYHYFHGKMDTHVATIGRLETELCETIAKMENASQDHEMAISNMQKQAEKQVLMATCETEKLREELAQLNAFAIQKKQMETRICELQDELATTISQFRDDKNAFELKAMFEKDRVKKEMLAHMKATKEALLVRTDGQLNTTTKRTMMENDHFMDELAFQSKETEKLLSKYQLVEMEVQQLRVENKILEENQLVMAKKNNYYQKIVNQLKKQTQMAVVAMENKDGYQEPDFLNSKTVLGAWEAEKQKWHEEKAKMEARVKMLEDSLRDASQWIHLCQQEKQFVVAQQDEIIQFLCRALQSVRGQGGEEGGASSPRSSTMTTTMSRVTTMEELVLSLPPLALDELSSDETRDVLLFLLAKMKKYQDQVAAIYQRSGGDGGAGTASGGGFSMAGNNRESLSKQLGVELPPISSALSSSSCVTSPLKVKRRMIHPYVATASTAGMTRPPQSPSSSPAVNQQDHRSPNPNSPNPNPLLAMATSNFNFLQPPPQSPPTKKTTFLTKRSESTSPVKLAAVKQQQRGGGGAGGASKRQGRGAAAGAGEDGDEEEDESSSSSLSLGAMPTAWSTDSLPVYADSEAVGVPPPHQQQQQQQQQPPSLKKHTSSSSSSSSPSPSASKRKG